jgi:hypothetical protein
MGTHHDAEQPEGTYANYELLNRETTSMSKKNNLKAFKVASVRLKMIFGMPLICWASEHSHGW